MIAGKRKEEKIGWRIGRPAGHRKEGWKLCCAYFSKPETNAKKEKLSHSLSTNIQKRMGEKVMNVVTQGRDEASQRKQRIDTRRMFFEGKDK